MYYSHLHIKLWAFWAIRRYGNIFTVLAINSPSLCWLTSTLMPLPLYIMGIIKSLPCQKAIITFLPLCQSSRIFSKLTYEILIVMARNFISNDAKNGAMAIVSLFNIFFITKIVHKV